MIVIKKIFTQIISLVIVVTVSAVIFANFLNTDIPADVRESGVSLSVTPEDSVYTDYLSFSHLPGVYTSDFLLEMYAENPEWTVRYTTDCTKPVSGSIKYTEPVRISASKDAGDTVSATVIRAAVFGRDGKQIGSEVTATYLVTDDPDSRYSSMIISIVAEPDDLYDYNRGIMVNGAVADDFRQNRPRGWPSTGNFEANYTQHGREWEREAHIEFFESDGSIMMSQNGGIRIQGGWTRANTQKSFRLFARDVYEQGKSLFYCDLFPGLTSIYGEPVDEFKTILLRTGSNNNSSNVITNQIMMKLADDTGVFNAASRFAAVYLNGVYYGIIGVYEDYVPEYFEAHYGLDRNYITCISGSVPISGGSQWEISDGPESELNEFKAMLDFISQNDMTNEDNYKKASEMLDIENFIEYMCFGSYIGIADWLGNNIKVWRYNKDGYNPEAQAQGYGYDGKWRFMLKDMDSAGGYGHAATNSLTANINSDGALKVNNAFRSLFKNYDFSCRVAATYADMMNTVFEPENALYSITETGVAAVGEMQYFLNYYGYNGKKISAWDNTTTTVRRFFIERDEFAFKDLKRKFSSEWDRVSVKISEGGSVRLNTILLDSGKNSEIFNYLGELEYPFEIIPDEGWELKSFSVERGKYYEDRDRIEFNAVGNNVLIKAEFVKSEDSDLDLDKAVFPSGLVINEVKYHAIASDKTPDWIELYNNSDKAVYLQGYRMMYVKTGGSINNNSDVKGKFKFPAIRIEPHEYIVIICDGIENTARKDSLHTKFKLSEGYDIVIVSSGGVNEADRMSIVSRGLKLGESHSLARNPDTGEWMYVKYTTPYEKNTVEPTGYTLISTVTNKNIIGKTLLNMTELESQCEKRGGKDGLWLDKAGIKKVFGSALSVSQAIDRLAGYEDDGGYYRIEDILSEMTTYYHIYMEKMDLNLYLKLKN